MPMLREALVLSFLAGNALHDLRTMTLNAYAAGIGTAAGLLYCILTGRPALSAFSAILPGGILLLFGILTKGAGCGDGICLMICGLFLTAEEAWALLIAGILCSFPVSLMLLFRHRSRRKELPFIPCLLIGYAGILIVRVIFLTSR